MGIHPLKDHRAMTKVRNKLNRLLRINKLPEGQATPCFYLEKVVWEKKLEKSRRHERKEREDSMMREEIERCLENEPVSERACGLEQFVRTKGSPRQRHGVSIQINGIAWNGR